MSKIYKEAAVELVIQEPVVTVLSTELPTGYHHNGIIVLSIRWCVWQVGEG